MTRFHDVWMLVVHFMTEDNITAGDSYVLCVEEQLHRQHYKSAEETTWDWVTDYRGSKGHDTYIVSHLECSR